MKKLYPILGIMLMIILITLACQREEAKKPSASFTYTPANGIKVGDVITFTNTSKDYQNSQWNFNDGSDASVAENPTHKFTEAGEYEVSLIVENKGLKDQTSELITVETNLEACFTISPNPAEVGQVLTFTNCSKGATSYEWDINGDGNINDTDETPVDWFFNKSGTYEVKLTVKSGSQTDEYTQILTIIPAADVDPTEYDLGEVWLDYYVNDFDESGDWWEGADPDYAATIADGYYTIENFSTETNYPFLTNAVPMPAETENYDLEAFIRLDKDDDFFGTGILWGYGDAGFYIYRYAGATYNMGDSENGLYLDWTSGGNETDFNKFTVRHYEGTFYYFLNEELVYQNENYGYFGDEFGFFAGRQSKSTVDLIWVWTMDFSKKKSAGLKSRDTLFKASSKGIAPRSLQKIGAAR